MSPAVRRLLPYALRYRRAFVLGLTCVLVTTAIQLLSPWILKHAIDDLNSGVTRQKLAMYAGLLLGVAMVGSVFRFLMRRILIGASRDIEFDLRNAFFARLQQMPLAYYQARRTGDLMSRATNDLNAVRMMVGPAVMYSSNTLLVFVVALILMSSIDARLTLMALLPLPLVTISVKSFGSAIHTRFEAIQAQLSDISAVVQEALSGVRVVRAYSQEAPRACALPRRECGVRAPQSRADPPPGHVLSEHDLLPRAGIASGPVVGQSGSHQGPDHARRFRGLQRISGHALVADDCVRLGHQHSSAGDGFLEAHERSPRRRS